jgi:peptidyl-prolyl cis-trans isomerase D
MALSFMRRHRRWLYGFLWLVIAAFIILYIPAFQSADPGSPAEVLAEVGGERITVGEFQRAYLRQRQRLEQVYQGRLDAAMMDRLALPEQALSALVEERVVALEARRLGLRVDDAEVGRHLQRAPELQRDGRFVGANELRRRLELAGVSEEEFTQSTRSQLLAERLAALLTDGITVSAAEVEREFRRQHEQVRAEYVVVDAARHEAGADPSEAEVAARFEQDRERYRTPERRSASYVLVAEQALRGRVSATEGELNSYYLDHRDQFREEEQVCAAHILVKVKSSPEAAEGRTEDEARQRAQEILDDLKAGADFAELARKASEDEGSAARGGDLGCFGRGQMVAEFDNAAFSLDPGTTSEPVRSTFGVHLIRVASRREERVRAMSEVKEQVRQIVLGQKAARLGEDMVEAIGAALRRGRGLVEAARPQGLEVVKSPAFPRAAPPPPLDVPTLAVRVFELTKGEVAPEPIAVAQGQVFVAVADIEPSRLPELKEARERVREDVRRDRALAVAAAQAEKLRALAEKEGLEKAGRALGYVRKETPGLVGRGQPLGELGSGLALEDAAFALPEKALSAPIRVEGGLAVMRVLEKKAFDPAAFEAQRGAISSSLRDQKKQQFFRSYLAEARRRFPVTQRTAALRRLLG